MPHNTEADADPDGDNGARVVAISLATGTIARMGIQVANSLSITQQDAVGNPMLGVPTDAIVGLAPLPAAGMMCPNTIGVEREFLVDAGDGDRRRLRLSRIRTVGDLVEYFVTDHTISYFASQVQDAVIGGMLAEHRAPKILQVLCAEVETICPSASVAIGEVAEDGNVYVFSAPTFPAAFVEGLPHVGGRRGVQLPVLPGTFDTELIVPLVAERPEWGDFGARLSACGFQGFWSMPISGSSRAVSGMFLVACRVNSRLTPLRHELMDIAVRMTAMVLGRERAMLRAQRAGFTDSLTSLPNRAGVALQVGQMIEEIQPGEEFSVVVYDLDRFQAIQDVHGHRVGEQVLLRIAENIGSLLHDGHILGHNSGTSEFIVVLRGVGRDKAIEAMQGNEWLAEDPLEIGGRRLYARGHMGLAVYPRDGESFETLFENSSIALHEARRLPSTYYQAYSGPNMSSWVRENALIGETLEAAIEHNDLTLVYQPQVQILDDVSTLYGVEALLRWRHPTLGAVDPGRIASISEEFGLNYRLTRWVVREAAKQLAQWRAEGLTVPRISVNLSAPDVYDPTLANDIRDVAAEFGIPPADLVLELTERIALSDDGGNLVCLDQFVQQDFPLALDDFGTGYSTLIHLSELPISELKVDKMFVQQSDPNAPMKPLLRWITQLATEMKVTVIVEGVEVAVQRDFLLAAGYSIFQGYYFSRPLEARQLRTWLDELDEDTAFGDTEGDPPMVDRRR
ncbi:putative bifunctional diguanylate cyclase/phosphodiesterase [Lysinibacter cavernae]|uniref:Diguanylate cyclase (GGDEF)-like protein n=1 Tax=Lysinibacter cavernae TaxID=1640652 RepID=A0A7X5R2W0_9MICO|nr:EAL domain-containing protein [Lysinibacter cavernae]NIH54566.1 diguanylate cyclase (GGDEF)-like protein [Lysinibacter cavernae]